jgi:hypothetical protein
VCRVITSTTCSNVGSSIISIGGYRYDKAQQQRIEDDSVIEFNTTSMTVLHEHINLAS